MRTITKKYIKDDDITIESIRMILYEIANGIRENNKINLTDINVICEEIFGLILNELFDIKLVSTSVEISGNFIAVDLIDYDNKIAFQVTSRSDRDKIKNTINKFNKSNISKMIERLNILILDYREHKYYNPNKVILDNDKEFSFRDNVYNFKRIIDLIAEKNVKENGFIVKIYKYINMVLDSGRIKYTNILKHTEILTNSIYCEIGEFALWKQGSGDIQLTAYIPLTFNEKVSCLLEFRKHNMSAIYITLNQEMLLKDYFIEEDKFIRRHNIGRYVDEDIIDMKIENIRFKINAYTGYNLYKSFGFVLK